MAAADTAGAALLQRFVDTTLPADQFHHQQHVQVAWLLSPRLRDDASDRLRDDASARQALDAEVDRIYAEFRANLVTTYRKDGVRCVPGADGVIRDLRSRGVKVALSTGFDRDVATLVLTALGWTRHTIDAVVCGDDVSNGRPAPDLILLAKKLTAVEDPAHVANVGDTANDLESASRAGVRWNVGVLTGAHTRGALERAPHTHIVPSVTELPF